MIGIPPYGLVNDSFQAVSHDTQKSRSTSIPMSFVMNDAVRTCTILNRVCYTCIAKGLEIEKFFKPTIKRFALNFKSGLLLIIITPTKSITILPEFPLVFW